MLTSQFQLNRILLHLALGLGGSLLILGGIYFVAARAGHDIAPAQLIAAIQGSSLGLFLVYVLMTLLGIVLRAWRYQVLLQASGETRLPSFRDLSLITMVRNMTVDLLPARLGELVFVGLLRQRAGTRVASGLSALMFAMLFDVLILAPLTIVLGLLVGFPNRQPYLLALLAIGILGLFLLAVRFLMVPVSRYLVSWSSSPNALFGKLSAFLESIVEAVDATMRAGVFGRVIGITLLVRLSKYAGLLCLYYGMTRSSFPALAELQSFKVLAAMIASEMTAALPIPALMSFGSWELGGMTLLAWFGALPNQALLVMLGTHVQTQAMDYGLGIAALVALFLFSRNDSKRGPVAGWKMVTAAVFAIAALAAAWFATQADKLSEPAARPVAQQIQRPADQPLPAWVKELEGIIVWSSNRAGNHDIWLMELPDGTIRPLTNDPHTENFARISPDGRKVVFARSHKPWQSFREDTPWDIWMVDIESGKEEKLAEWGISPAWSPDGSFIVFQRNPGKIMALDMQTRKERIYYQSGQDAQPSRGSNLMTPTVGSQGRLAFTYRDRGKPINMIRNPQGQMIELRRGACQAQWTPSGEFVSYIDDGGKQKNLIMRYDASTGKTSPWLDLPGDFSHEYFVRLSRDERYMVFAASDGGHEHDLANYELFLWQVGSRPETAARLTFNNLNDSWPDLRLGEH